MTKTYTEQWRDGTLSKGWYYVKTHCGEIKKLYCGDGESLELDDPETSAYYFYHRENGKGQVEVLGPVPGYMDCKGLIYDSIALNENRKRIDELKTKFSQLEKKLEIATKALSDIEDGYSESTGAGQTVRQALKEMEGVK